MRDRVKRSLASFKLPFFVEFRPFLTASFERRSLIDSGLKLRNFMEGQLDKPIIFGAAPKTFFGQNTRAQKNREITTVTKTKAREPIHCVVAALSSFFSPEKFF